MLGLRRNSVQDDKASDKTSRRSPLRILIAILFAPILLLTSAGCAQKHPSPVATLKPNDHAAHGPRVAGQIYAEVELEDDGREAQQPPLVRSRRVHEDDPTEPFSPNYGRSSSDLETAQTTDDGDPQSTSQHARLKPQEVNFQPSMLR